MPRGFHQNSYVPYPVKRRFYSSFFDGGENCYTEEEIELRNFILKERKSKITKEYLKTDNVWFNPAFDTAFDTVNQNSWLYPKRFKPRTKLSLDDFTFDSINAHDKKWASPGKLIKEISDYLHKRNKEFSSDYLNQPMNMFLIDLADILQNIAVDGNEERVSESLGALMKYIHSIARTLDPSMGSDLFFLADLQDVIADEFMLEINQFIESKKLKNALMRLHGDVQNYAVEVNKILHHALSSKEVNKNTYLELLCYMAYGDVAIEKFPSAALSRCLKGSDSDVVLHGIKSSIAHDSKKLVTIVDNCQDLYLIKGVSSEIKTAYAESIVKLNELLQFSHSLNDLIKLLDDTCEIMGVIQLNSDIQDFLLKMIDVEKELNKSVQIVFKGNRQKYREIIEKVQSMSSFSKLFSSDLDMLSQFIKNQGLLYDDSLTSIELSNYVAKVEDKVASVNRNLKDLSSQSAQHELLTDANRFVIKTVTKMNQLAGKLKQPLAINKGDENAQTIEALVTPSVQADGSHLDETITTGENNQEIQREPYIESMVYTSAANKITPPLENWMNWVKRLLWVSSNNDASMEAFNGITNQHHYATILSCDILHLPESLNGKNVGVCYGKGYQAYVIPQQGSFEDIPYGGDYYSSCKKINFYGTDSLSCEGMYSTAVYQVNSINHYEQFFTSLPSSIMLYVVLAKMASNVYRALLDKNNKEDNETFDSGKWSTVEDETKFLLARLHGLKVRSKDTSIEFSVDDFQYQYNHLVVQKKSLKKLMDLKEDMEYFLKSYTPACKESINQFIDDTESKIINFGLNRDELQKIEVCLNDIVHRENTPPRMRQSVDDTLKQLNISSETVMNLVDIFKRIQLIESNQEEIFESELVDIDEQLNKIIESNEPCAGIEELVEYYLFEKKLINKRALSTSIQLSDYGFFAYSTQQEAFSFNSDQCYTI